MRPWPGAGWRRHASGGALALGLLLVAAPAPAQEGGQVSVHASLDPATVKLGEPAVYRGRLILPHWQNAKWLPPEPEEALTWGPLSPRRIPAAETGRQDDPRARQLPSAVAYDTLEVETTIQAFRTGDVPIPGLRFQLEGGGSAQIHRLPNVNLIVTPVLSPADSNAELRPVRGPIAAPWWERVPWTWVGAGLFAAALAAAAIVASRRRRARRPAPPPAPVPVPDAAAIALAELAALRGLSLPAHGRFAEHIYHLTRILRRYLETVTRAPLPGDTTPELIAHLQATEVGADERLMLEGMLRLWDRVKFARQPSTIAEAERAEHAVEILIRRHAPAPAAHAATPAPTAPKVA